MGESRDSNSLSIPPFEYSPFNLMTESHDTSQIPKPIEESLPTETTEARQSPRDRAASLLSSLQQEILGSSSPHLPVTDGMQQLDIDSPFYVPLAETELKENNPPDINAASLAHGQAATPAENSHDFDVHLLKDRSNYDRSPSESNGMESPTSVWSLYSLPPRLPNLDFSPSIAMTQLGNTGTSDSTTN